MSMTLALCPPGKLNAGVLLRNSEESRRWWGEWRRGTGDRGRLFGAWLLGSGRPAGRPDGRCVPDSSVAVLPQRMTGEGVIPTELTQVFVRHKPAPDEFTTARVSDTC